MNIYLTLKALHLIAVISWMAGLLYLPRIFVYHVENNNDQNVSNIFKVMERKLYFYIMMPAMVLSWIFGLLLISSIGFDQLANKWLEIKLILVLILTIYHLFLGVCLKKFSIEVDVIFNDEFLPNKNNNRKKIARYCWNRINNNLINSLNRK